MKLYKKFLFIFLLFLSFIIIQNSKVCATYTIPNIPLNNGTEIDFDVPNWITNKYFAFFVWEYNGYNGSNRGYRLIVSDNEFTINTNNWTFYGTDMYVLTEGLNTTTSTASNQVYQSQWVIDELEGIENSTSYNDIPQNYFDSNPKTSYALNVMSSDVHTDSIQALTNFYMKSYLDNTEVVYDPFLSSRGTGRTNGYGSFTSNSGTGGNETTNGNTSNTTNTTNSVSGGDSNTQGNNVVDENTPQGIMGLLGNLLESLFVPSQERLDAISNLVSGKFAFVDTLKNVIPTISNTFSENMLNSPTLSMNLNSTKYTNAGNYTILDFTWYAPYKQYGDLILTAFIYIFYFWRLFIHLPSVIHGTAGDVHIIDLQPKGKGGN